MMNAIMRRLRALFHRDEVERELDDEVRFHLEKETELYISRGMSPADARRAAHKSFGGSIDAYKEEARDVRGVRWIEETAQDLRYASRMLRKAPGFALVAIVSLALGIGANTALFSVVDSVLIEKLPVHDPDGLALFEWEAGRAFRNSGTAGYGAGDTPPGRRANSSFHYRLFEAMRGESDGLVDLVGFASLWDANIVSEGQSEKHDAQLVSGRFFDVVGVPLALGRGIEPSDDSTASPGVVVLSYPYWRDRFGSDPNVLGKIVEINKVPLTVVGVTGQGFAGTLQVDTDPIVYAPLAYDTLLRPDESMIGAGDKPGVWFVNLIGRLKPGATLETARDGLNARFQALALEMMPAPKKASEPAALDPKDYPILKVRSGSRGMTETRRIFAPTIYTLFGVVGLVLLIACANVANMLLARSTARSAEIVLRLAMGAGRIRLVRQLLTESLLLSLLGGALGLVLGVWGTSLLAAIGATEARFVPDQVHYGLSTRVLLFTIGVSVATGVLFGLVPAWRASRLDLSTSMKEGSRTVGGVTRSRLSKALVVAQVAMSLVLLVGAGLFVRTVRNLQNASAGFDERNLLVFTVQPGSAGYKDERLFELHRQISSRVEAIPGVRAVTFSHVPLIANYINDTNVYLPGESESSEAEHDSNRQVVRENFFDTLGIPILRGRGFTAQDSAAGQKVAIVSEEFVRRFMPEVDPIGQRIGFDKESLGQYEIVGVSRDTKYSDKRNEFQPCTYTPWLQDADAVGRLTYEVRTSGDPTPFETAVRQAVREIDSSLPVTDVATQEAQARRTFATERTLANILSFFGLVALLLAAIGLYGVMAYSVAQRTNEIGIRMALGANVGGVLRLVVWQGLKFALVGLVVGAAGSFALKRFVESQLYGVEPADPVTFAAVTATLVTAAVLACLVPAIRAAHVDPVEALRSE